MNNLKKLKELNKNASPLGPLDTLDLDESVIDEKLDSLMKKSVIEQSHLQTILTFLRYKYMICLQEETDCENEIYISFTIKLLLSSSSENTNILLEILSTSLLLCPERLHSVVEHILQQVMSVHNINSSVSEDSVNIKIMDTILELCIENKVPVNATFLYSELEKMIIDQEKLLTTHFFSKTVPLFINCCQDYNILNMTWDRILSRQNMLNKNDFAILCSLSEFYLPLSTDDTFGKIESTVLETYEFWNVIHFGFLHKDYSVRKCSIYLARRAIHCAGDRQITVHSSNDNQPIFVWKREIKNTLESSWFALFTLLETLEEKQSHLVLSALKLFNNLPSLHQSWYNCALIRTFSHDANAVVQQAIEIALKNDNQNVNIEDFPFKQLIIALDNTYLYENVNDYEKNQLVPLLKIFLKNKNNMINIISALPLVNLSPIPKFYISFALMSVPNIEDFNIPLKTVVSGFFGSNSPILNNAMIQCATECCFLHFVLKQSVNIFGTESLVEILSPITMKKILTRRNLFWQKLIEFVKEKCCDTSIEKMIIDKSYLEKFTDYETLTRFLVILSDSSALNFVYTIKMMLMYLKEFENREYSSNTEFDRYFFLIVNIIDVVDATENDRLKTKLLNEIFEPHAYILADYLKKQLRSSSEIKDLELINQYVKGVGTMVTYWCRQENFSLLVNQSLESLFTMAIYLLKTSECLSQIFFSLKIVSKAVTFYTLTENYDKGVRVERIKLLYNLTSEVNTPNKEESEISVGKTISEFNQAKLQVYILYFSQVDSWSSDSVNKLYDEIIYLLEAGGHGCLLLIIRLTEILLPNLVYAELINEIKTLVNIIWRESFELRKNEQFRICFKAFTKMLFQKNLLMSNLLNSTLLEYGEKIFELGEQIPFIVQEFMEHLGFVVTKDIPFYYTTLLSKALVFGMALRKDQRIEYECCDFINKFSTDFLIPEEIKYTVNPIPQIRAAALEILKTRDLDTHAYITLDLRNKVDLINKPNNRYHGNSMQHRLLLRTLQSLLFSFKIYPDGSHVDNNVRWCIQRLAKQPHHISTKIMLEWYIVLYFIHKKLPLNQTAVTEFHLLEIPQISYFMIIYQIIKYRILKIETSNKTLTSCLYEDFNFAMQLFLPYTMGQLFNLRLHAQYFSLKLNELFRVDPLFTDNFKLICKTIQTTFDLSSSEKNLFKISNDFYVNHFDTIHGLHVNNIYYNIPLSTGVAQEEHIYATVSNEADSESNFINMKYSDSNESIKRNEKLVQEEINKMSNPDTHSAKSNHLNIQKKFVPWRNMLADLGIPTGKQKESNNSSNLIVVASLIDRAPNLGGLARTCEVFGVKEYVIDSLKHLEDKQFQTLSVSSERWINNIVEMAPGVALKKYLIEMKNKGYVIVGAEQTSSSITLQNFKFPRNCLLLLGHEKEGIPCDILSFLDYCVEIPQHGLVRSLNVHVTASIFIWEYTRQHSL